MSERRSPGGLYVEESGTPGSPAIVFIHGAGQSSREWRQHMDRLPGFHCLAPDLPGFGRSNHLGSATKERVADLLARLIEERVPARRASVVGISSGGLHIHALLDRHPDRVERAVIDGSPPFGTPRIGRAIMRLFAYVMAPFIHTRPGAACGGAPTTRTTSASHRVWSSRGSSGSASGSSQPSMRRAPPCSSPARRRGSSDR